MMMKKTIPVALAALALAFGAPATSQASDHIDGLKTALDNSADLTDVFSFVSPKDSTKLVLIMNVHTLALGISKFSNAVDYKFRIRPIDNRQTLAPSSDPSKEQSITCNFTAGGLLSATQHATCNFNFGNGDAQSISFDTRGPNYSAGGSADQGGIKVFAGVRSDPWFLDLIRTVKFNNAQSVGTGPGTNGLWGQNVLSIAVEVDKSRLAGPLLAITAQTVRK